MAGDERGQETEYVMQKELGYGEFILRVLGVGDKESEREVERQREGRGEKTERDRERQRTASSETERGPGGAFLGKREIGSGRSLSVKGASNCLGSSCQTTRRANIILRRTSIILIPFFPYAPESTLLLT